jgi:dsDNA-specific endonuclease/ATPase MutS2
VTGDLMARRAVRPPVPLSGLDDPAPILFRLGPAGLVLPAEDLLDLFVLVELSEAARGAVPLPDLPLPFLAALLAPLADLSDLAGEKDRIFEADGRVRDTATVRLHSIRAAILRLRRDVVKRLSELAREKADVLSEGYVTEKGGRYCLPLRADRREALSGIVHETSGSGQTLFVEPLAAVEANNALVEALEEEREEVHRILASVTARLAARKADLLNSVAILTDLDASEARGTRSSTGGSLPSARRSSAKTPSGGAPTPCRSTSTSRRGSGFSSCPGRTPAEKQLFSRPSVSSRFSRKAASPFPPRGGPISPSSTGSSSWQATRRICSAISRLSRRR